MGGWGSEEKGVGRYFCVRFIIFFIVVFYI